MMHLGGWAAEREEMAGWLDREEIFTSCTTHTIGIVINADGRRAWLDEI